MLNHRRRVVGISGVVLGVAFLGCGGEVESPPAESDQFEITPAMEKMKQDMMMAKYGQEDRPGRPARGREGEGLRTIGPAPGRGAHPRGRP